MRFPALPNILLVLLAIVAASPQIARAHCDGMDGPVVQAARKALESGNVNLVLIWVQKQDEPAIKQAFQSTLAIRRLSPEAKQLADTYFFETLVRIHRAGEGAPYTGLKPAGRDLGPAIPAADRALKEKSPEALQKLLTDTLQDSLREHFARVSSQANVNPDDVEAGRAYVKEYVEFIHFAERLYQASTTPAHGHAEEP
ncbi:MAG TPA: DUF6448 family protein [Terriglobia bacterium]|nr:DUF6448 family protein [Terriglobia bacterium]